MFAFRLTGDYALRRCHPKLYFSKRSPSFFPHASSLQPSAVPDFVKILILAIVQGAAELLPVSSSAHVTVAARLLGYDIDSTDIMSIRWTFLLIMLHTGTMVAVLLFFWRRWKPMVSQLPVLIVATLITGLLGLGFQQGYQKVTGRPIETLFHNLPLIAAALVAAAVLILISGYRELRSPAKDSEPGWKRGLAIGLVQGLCLPFRGFSRSGATISTAMLSGVQRLRAEEFSFALAVLLTPPLVVQEALKVMHNNSGSAAQPLSALFLPGLTGMVLSFATGLLALKWLSRWMDEGRWHWFGYYCIVAAVVVFAISRMT